MSINFWRHVDAVRKLYAKTDVEIANLLQEHVWAHEDILEARSELIANAIERLHRANAGALVIDDEHHFPSCPKYRDEKAVCTCEADD